MSKRDHTLEDHPGAPRAGEALDSARLRAWVRHALPDLQGDMHIAQFPGGHSNLTYLVSVGDTEMVLRRPPPGTKAASAHDMGREFRVLSKLHGIYPYAPRALAHCRDTAVLGAEFYLMQRCRGIILRQDLPEGLSLSPQQARGLCENFIDALVALHTLDYRNAGLADLGKPEGYAQRQVSGWSERFTRARTDDVPDCKAIMAWLGERQPGDSGHVGVIHNDYKFDNIVLEAADGLDIVAVLDWEMATLGDPFMDLGAALAYWVQADDRPARQALRMGPTHLPGMLTRTELVARYSEQSGYRIDDIDFYHVFGLFRLAVIAQQIYYRYHHGQVADPRFARFGKFVACLADECEFIIGPSKPGKTP